MPCSRQSCCQNCEPTEERLSQWLSRRGFLSGFRLWMRCSKWWGSEHTTVTALAGLEGDDFARRTLAPGRSIIAIMRICLPRHVAHVCRSCADCFDLVCKRRVVEQKKTRGAVQGPTTSTAKSVCPPCIWNRNMLVIICYHSTHYYAYTGSYDSATSLSSTNEMPMKACDSTDALWARDSSYSSDKISSATEIRTEACYGIYEYSTCLQPRSFDFFFLPSRHQKVCYSLSEL